MFGGFYNRLYYVYEITIDTHDGPITYYWYGSYDDVTVLGDGTCSVDYNRAIVSESSSSFGFTNGDFLECNSQHYYVAGFADLESFFNEHIASMLQICEYKQTLK